MPETTSQFIARLQADDIQLWLEGDRLRLSGPEDLLDEERIASIQRRKADIVAYLAALQDDQPVNAPAIPAVDRRQPLPLSFAQERLWFIHQWEGGSSAAYHIPSFLRLHGPLCVTALADSLEALIQRHDILRTAFHQHDDLPVQSLASYVVKPFHLIDLTSLAENRAAEIAERCGRFMAFRPFNLQAAPLLRVQVVRFDPAHHLLQITFHHLITDGWSADVLIREWIGLYDARINMPAWPGLEAGDLQRLWQSLAPADQSSPFAGGHALEATVVRFCRAITERWGISLTPEALKEQEAWSGLSDWIVDLLTVTGSASEHASEQGFL